MAICTWGLLNEEWNSVTGWTDNDINGAVSSISPVGQLYLDCRAVTVDGSRARRTQDVGTFGTGNLTVYMRFKGDVWDDNSTVSQSGLKPEISAGTNRLVVVIGNQCDGSTDGVWVLDNAGAYQKVITKTWDNNWHTIQFDIHNSQTDVDIYIDDSLEATDADMAYSATTDGEVTISGYGTVTGNGEYHVDYIKINSGLCDPTEKASNNILWFP